MENTVKPYVDLKREMLAHGLFSCSQVGFNIAIGPLARLRVDFSELLARIFAADEHWVTPPVIREDWIPDGAWHDPADKQWIRTAPLGHVLTPLPAMHLFNRLRHHPATGVFHLSGWCARQEEDTLPLLRQIAFQVEQRVHIEKRENVPSEVELVEFNALQDIALALELPVVVRTAVGLPTVMLCLALPETPEVPLTTVHTYSSEWLAAYGMEWAEAHSVACGVERWCLAIIARHGADPQSWPDLSSASTAG